MSDCRRRWELVEMMTTAWLRLLSSPLWHMDPTVGAVGRPMRAGPGSLPGRCRAFPAVVAGDHPYLPGSPAARWLRRHRASGQGGKSRAGLAGRLAPCMARGGRKRRRAAGKAAAGRREITPPGALSHILPSGAFPAALPAPAPAPVAVGTKV